MKPSPEALRSEALMRLERTRAAWLVRCASSFFSRSKIGMAVRE